MSSGQSPTISVCIPTHNGMPYLEEAIHSVINQTYTDWELVISDDRSTDGSAEYASKFANHNIRVFFNREKPGPEGNWNHCISQSRGVYTKLLCQDDKLNPRCLARQIETLEKYKRSKVSMTASARNIIRPDGDPIMVRRWKNKPAVVSAEKAIREIIRSGTNPIGEPSAVLFKKSDWVALNGFKADFPYLIDLDFWLRLLSLGDFAYDPESLCDFRISNSSWSSKLSRVQSRQYRDFMKKYLTENPDHASRSDMLWGNFKSIAGGYFRRLIFTLTCHDKKS